MTFSSSAALRAPSRHEMMSKPAVLLVEDEEHLRLLAGRILERSGHRVIPAQHALDALDILREHAHDVGTVLSDVLMPNMDGVTFAEEIRRRFPHLRIVLMSGYGADDLAAVGVARWTDGVLSKPFTARQLIDAVDGESGPTSSGSQPLA